MEDAAAGSWSPWVQVACSCPSKACCSPLQPVTSGCSPSVGSLQQQDMRHAATAGRPVLDGEQKRGLQQAAAQTWLAAHPSLKHATAAGMATTSSKASPTLWPLPAPSPSSLTLGASCSRHQRQPQRPLSLWPSSHGRPSVALLLIQGQKYLQGTQEIKLRGSISDGVEMEMPAGDCSGSTPVVAACYRPADSGYVSGRHGP